MPLMVLTRRHSSSSCTTYLPLCEQCSAHRSLILRLLSAHRYRSSNTLVELWAGQGCPVSHCLWGISKPVYLPTHLARIARNTVRYPCCQSVMLIQFDAAGNLDTMIFCLLRFVRRYLECIPLLLLSCAVENFQVLYESSPLSRQHKFE